MGKATCISKNLNQNHSWLVFPLPELLSTTIEPKISPCAVILWVQVLVEQCADNKFAAGMYATILSHRAEQTLFSEDCSAPYVLLLSVTKKGKRTRPIVSIPGLYTCESARERKKYPHAHFHRPIYQSVGRIRLGLIYYLPRECAHTCSQPLGRWRKIFLNQQESSER